MGQDHPKLEVKVHPPSQPEWTHTDLPVQICFNLGNTIRFAAKDGLRIQAHVKQICSSDLTDDLKASWFWNKPKYKQSSGTALHYGQTHEYYYRDFPMQWGWQFVDPTTTARLILEVPSLDIHLCECVTEYFGEPGISRNLRVGRQIRCDPSLEEDITSHFRRWHKLYQVLRVQANGSYHDITQEVECEPTEVSGRRVCPIHKKVCLLVIGSRVVYDGQEIYPSTQRSFPYKKRPNQVMVRVCSKEYIHPYLFWFVCKTGMHGCLVEMQ